MKGYSSYGQESQLYFDKITTQHGLSHNKVNCILKDQRGFIWFGTDDGLNRYDGKNFIRFQNKRGDTTTISGNIIRDIFEDKDGVLWIATSDGGLSSYNYRLEPKKQFRQYKYLSRERNAVPVTLNALVEDKLGNLWLATSGRSVLRFNKEKGLYDEPEPKGLRTMLALCLDKDGVIWAGREGGSILKIDPKKDTFWEDPRYRALYADLPHATVTSLFKDNENNIWFGSWDEVLFKYNPTTGVEEVFKKNQSSNSFENDEINSFAQDANGRIWMGGNNKGLHIYDKKKNRFYNLTHDPSREGTIADNRINCVFIDSSGRVWIGTDKGISVNDPSRQQFVQSFLPDAGSGLQQTLIYGFFEDENGGMWTGTSRGIYYRSGPDEQLEHRPLKYKGTDLHVTTFFKSPSGQMYIGTNYSVFTYDPEKNSIALLPNTEKDTVMTRLIESRIVSIVQTVINGNDVLLVSPYGHYIAYYDLKDKKWISRLDSSQNIIQRFNLRDNLVRKFVKANNGRIWLATVKTGLGLWVNNPHPKVSYFNNEIPDAIANNNVYDIAQDENGNLWVSTYGSGLYHFNISTGNFDHVVSSNNLIEGLQTDHHGNVWMVSNGMVHKYDPKRNSYTSYELPDLEKSGGVKGYIYKDRKGYMYVSGANYYIRFHPDFIREQKGRLKVHLTDFFVFNNSFSHLLYDDEIKLSYKKNYFTIDFAAPDFSSGDAISYSYMLEGFDEDWIDAGNRNFVSYSNLGGGTYIFKVRATNVPGVWSKEFTTKTIVIRPPVWRRLWFYILAAVVLASIVYIVYRYRINELLKRQAIRNKIAQDLHDNVGSTLSSISVYSQVAKIYHARQSQDDLQTTLEKISSTSSEMISEMNDIVWAINPRNDNMSVILQRMESFARPLLAAQGINFEFRYDESITSLNLAMETRKNFYLIFKESVNNSIKYSGARQIAVDISQKASHIIMSIKDDGKGFDLAKTSQGHKSSDVFGGGNGLKNMQLRAKEMKGSLVIQSQPGKGALVKLEFPIT